jgi:hypothetical protein
MKATEAKLLEFLKKSPQFAGLCAASPQTR